MGGCCEEGRGGGGGGGGAIEMLYHFVSGSVKNNFASPICSNTP